MGKILIPKGGNDRIMTPDPLAQWIVDYFKPVGKILEPCAGDGAFLRAFADYDGRNQFAYKGKEFLFVDKAIKLWKSAPIAWSCDLGITDKGETVVVECNDVMALGFYGLQAYKAGEILEKRWTEIHRNKST